MNNLKTEPLLETDIRHSSFARNIWFQVAFLMLVGVVAYANSFSVPFLFDDESSIVNNEYIRDLYGFLSDGYAYNPNRFIGYLSFAINYAWGGLTIVGYHAVNLSIHLANTLLILRLVRLLLRTPLVASKVGPECLPDDKSANFLAMIPFFVALLFVCHPLQTQAVTYIVQRFTSLATLFYLASMILYLSSRLASESGIPAFSIRVALPLLFSVICAVLAMKTKEIAATLPLMVLLAEIALFGRINRKQVVLLVPVILTLLIIPVTMLNLSKASGDILSDVSAKMTDVTPFSRGEYVVTQFGVIVRYLRLLLLPIGQNLDHDIPISHSLLELRPLLSLILILGIVAGTVALWRRGSPGSRSSMAGVFRLAAFGMIWFFIALAVESSIIPIRDVMYEHRVYLPSIGFILTVVSLAALAAGQVSSKYPWTWMGVSISLVVVALFLTGATVMRNRVWRDGITLWSDVRDKSPGKYRAYGMLGTYYAEEGQTPEALVALETAIRLNPKAYDSMFNLAQVYGWLGRDQEAEAILATVKLDAPERYQEFDAVYKSQFGAQRGTR